MQTYATPFKLCYWFVYYRSLFQLSVFGHFSVVIVQIDELYCSELMYSVEREKKCSCISIDEFSQKRREIFSHVFTLWSVRFKQKSFPLFPSVRPSVCLFYLFGWFLDFSLHDNRKTQKGRGKGGFRAFFVSCNHFNRPLFQALFICWLFQFKKNKLDRAQIGLPKVMTSITIQWLSRPLRVGVQLRIYDGISVIEFRYPSNKNDAKSNLDLMKGATLSDLVE